MEKNNNVNSMLNKTKAFFAGIFSEHGRTDEEKTQLSNLVLTPEDNTAIWAQGIWDNPDQFVGGARVVAVLGKPDGAAPVIVAKRWGKLGNRHGVGNHTRFVQFSLLPGSERTTWATHDPETGEKLMENVYIENGQGLHFKFFETEFDHTGGDFGSLYDFVEEELFVRTNEEGKKVYLSTRLVMLLQTRDVEEENQGGEAQAEKKDKFGLSLVVTAAVIIELPNSRAADPTKKLIERGVLRSTPAEKPMVNAKDVLDSLKASIDVIGEMGDNTPDGEAAF